MSAKVDREVFKVNREKMIQRLIENWTDTRLKEIKEYYERLERKFQADKKRLSKQYEEELASKKLDPDIKDRIDDYFSDEHFEIENIFLKNIRYTTIITLYSLLEFSLNDLCQYLCKSKGLTLSLDELRGDGIERAKLYLTKVCRINFPENTHEWKEIQKLNEIRNCIVHALGDVENIKSPGKLKNIIKNTKGVDLENNRFIRIDSTYILSMIENTEKLFAKVYEKGFLN